MRILNITLIILDICYKNQLFKWFDIYVQNN